MNKSIILIVLIFAAIAMAKKSSTTKITPDLADKINSHGKSFTACCTFFAEQNVDEIAQTFGYVPYTGPDLANIDEIFCNAGLPVPDYKTHATNWDWTLQNNTGNQCLGSTPLSGPDCDSNWAFAAVRQFESRLCLSSETQTFNAYSSQYMLDCDNGDEGCSGGNLQGAGSFLYNVGVPPEECDSYQDQPWRCTN